MRGMRDRVPPSDSVRNGTESVRNRTLLSDSERMMDSDSRSLTNDTQKILKLLPPAITGYGIGFGTPLV
jgi:hypothetical protein